jgi:thioesterase domain-containing protein/acyl carrier protein
LSVEFIEDTEDRWWLRVEYDISLFDYARMTKMLNDYLRLLEAVAAQPELRLSRLTSLVKTEGEVAARNGHSLTDRELDRIEASHREALNLHLEDKGEPPDALEQIMVRIWERVLCTSGIGIRDNFFDLGGHSLLAAQLVSEVEKAVGRPIPLSALFRGSTIESFAEVIQSGVELSPDPLVMELNAGTRGLPIFAIVQPGWDALGYALLARHMGAEQPFYKLQASPKALSIATQGMEEFRTIAGEYVPAMRAIQPKGPYLLISMCSGVHIAEQMVLELEAQGHEVGFFGIVDTFVLQHSQIRWLARLESLRLTRQRISKLPFSARFSHYKQAIERRLGLREKEPINPWTKAMWPGKEFQPKQFRAPVILFRRPKQPYFNVKDRGMGWSSRSLSGVTVCTVNVTAREEMLREQAVQVMAEKLKDAVHQSEKCGSFRTRLAEPMSITT